MLRMILLIVALAAGCTTAALPSVLPFDAVTQTSSSFSHPRRSLPWSYGGVSYVGVDILHRQSRMSIDFQIPPDTVLFTLQSCSRDLTVVRPRAGAFRWDYTPFLFLESQDPCYVEATAYLANGGRVSAMFDVSNTFQLGATLYCNGDRTKPSGGAWCQVRAGRLLWLSFAEEVVEAHAEGCPAPTPSRQLGHTFEIASAAGRCEYGFRSRSGENFRLTVWGWDSILDLGRLK